MSACQKHLASADQARTISGGDDTLADGLRYAEAAFLFALSGWAGSIPGEDSRGSDEASQLIDLLAQRCAQTLSRALASSKSVAMMPPVGSTLVAAALQIAELLALAGCHLPCGNSSSSSSGGGSGSTAACEQVERLLWRSGTIDGKRGITDPALAARPFLHDPGPLRRLWQHSASQHKRVVPLVAASGKTKVLPPRGPDSRPWRYGGEYGDGGLSGGGAGRAAPGHQMAPRPHMLFSDPTLPLILDLGCGFGVSILGLAVAPSTAFALSAGHGGKGGGKEGNSSSLAPFMKALGEGRVNYLGCDLSGHAIGYAASTAHRWKLSKPIATEAPDPYAPTPLALAAHERPPYVRGPGECAFTVTDALSAARWATAVYPGALAGVLVQFPTPYKLKSPAGGEEAGEEADWSRGQKNSGKDKVDEGKKLDGDESHEGISKDVKSEAASRPMKKSKLERAERRKNLQRAFQGDDDSKSMQSSEKAQAEQAFPRKQGSQGNDTTHQSKHLDKDEKPLKRREAGPSSGNVQLPSSHADSTFMVSSELMTCAVAGLAPGGCLLVQSNVEDVAVTMADLVASADCPDDKELHSKKAKKEKKAKVVENKTEASVEGKLYPLSVSDASACPASRAHATSTQVLSPSTASASAKVPRGGEREEEPLRQRLWASLCGQRAIGAEWLPFNPLSCHARTETESVYDEDRKPVHRRAWVAKGDAAF